MAGLCMMELVADFVSEELEAYMYIGHKNEQGEFQALRDHLGNVAELAGQFGASFHTEAHARRIGALHDAGKYSPAAQRRMACLY